MMILAAKIFSKNKTAANLFVFGLSYFYAAPKVLSLSVANLCTVTADTQAKASFRRDAFRICATIKVVVAKMDCATR